MKGSRGLPAHVPEPGMASNRSSRCASLRWLNFVFFPLCAPALVGQSLKGLAQLAHWRKMGAPVLR